MKRLLLLFALVAALAASVAGAANAGQITGQVYNANTGAAIPNVNVRYTNICTGAVGETRSNSSGFYSFTTSNACNFQLLHYYNGKPCCDGFAYWANTYSWNGFYITVNIPLTHI